MKRSSFKATDMLTYNNQYRHEIWDLCMPALNKVNFYCHLYVLSAILQLYFLFHDRDNVSFVFESHSHSGYWSSYNYSTIVYIANEREWLHY